MQMRSTAVWSLHDAKNRFSEVVREAMESGPQTITRRGDAAIIIVDERHGRPHGDGVSI